MLENKWGNVVAISDRTLETLIDLVEIKLSYMEVIDREDRRELINLERCLGEFRSLMDSARQGDAVVAFPKAGDTDCTHSC